MRPEQKIVAVGAASGVVLMLLGVWVLTGLLPRPAITDTIAERLAYALKANMVAVVPLFVMIITIANSRFLSDAIDPTRRAESRSMEIHGRVADNTLQQNFVFAVRNAAIADGSPGHLMSVPGCVDRPWLPGS